MDAHLGFANGYPNVVLDLGNYEVKMMADILPNVSCGIHFRHARIEIGRVKYERLAHSYSGSGGQYQFIEWDDRYFIVGDQAYSAGTVQNQTGRKKYTRDYYGVIFVSGLLRLFEGDIPEKINVFAAHPPLDYEMTDALKKSIVGTWVVGNLGRKVRFRVEYVSVFDEIVGGAMNVVLAPDGRRYNDHPIVEDGPTLVCDLGGGTLDIVRLQRDGTVDYGRIGSRGVGINDAIVTFKELFGKKYPDVVADTDDGLPVERIHECFLDKEHRVRFAGDYINCQDIYTDATTMLINAVKEGVREMSKGAVNYNHALITGGGGGLLYYELAEQVFAPFHKSKSLHMADKREEMIFANARGGKKLLVPLMETSRRAAIKRGAR